MDVCEEHMAYTKVVLRCSQRKVMFSERGRKQHDVVCTRRWISKHGQDGRGSGGGAECTFYLNHIDSSVCQVQLILNQYRSTIYCDI